MHVLEADNISKVYGRKIVLYNFSLRIKEGEIFGLGSYKYDREFLGYMEGILPLVYAEGKGFVI